MNEPWQKRRAEYLARTPELHQSSNYGKRKAVRLDAHAAEMRERNAWLIRWREQCAEIWRRRKA